MATKSKKKIVVPLSSLNAVGKTLDVKLTDLDGNAFAIMGALRKQARQDKWTDEEVKLMIQSMLDATDYDHLLQIAIAYTK